MLKEEIEIWKDVPEYEGLYQVSSNGIVRSVDRLVNCKNKKVKQLKGKVLNQHFDGAGKYKFVGLYKNSNSKCIYVHRLVALAYEPNPNNLPEVNHKDGDKLNNCHFNLEWVTPKGNMRHAADTGLLNIKSGEESGRSKLILENVLEIRRLYNSGDYNQMQLANKFKIDGGYVSNIIKGKAWAHITEGVSAESHQKRGSQSVNSKLTEENVVDIKKMFFDRKISVKKICNLFNVHETTIRYVINGKSWKHIN